MAFISRKDQEVNKWQGLAITNILLDTQYDKFTNDSSSFDVDTIKTYFTRWCSPFTSSNYWTGSNSHNIGVIASLDFYCSGSYSTKMIDFGISPFLSEYPFPNDGTMIPTGSYNTTSQLTEITSQSRFDFNKLSTHIKSNGYNSVVQVIESKSNDKVSESIYYNPSDIFKNCVSHSLAKHGISGSEHTNANYPAGLDGSLTGSVNNDRFVLRYLYDPESQVDITSGESQSNTETYASSSNCEDIYISSASRSSLETKVLNDEMDDGYKIYRSYVMISSGSLVYLS